MVQTMPEKVVDPITAQIPLGRLGRPAGRDGVRRDDDAVLLGGALERRGRLARASDLVVGGAPPTRGMAEVMRSARWKLMSFGWYAPRTVDRRPAAAVPRLHR